ncbi:glycosyltransferase family 4 protein [Aurantibacter crassamenti]|uniref:glycosyltransferase family 4 protein n=1 Tax=Aurantibacter crassamenti TaxID=1837375 RepID=UPI001EEF483B|nr:glycosyltransferase family 4 protein [Aurantibacter crassamenti]
MGSKVHSQLYQELDDMCVEQHIFHPLREHNKENPVEFNFKVNSSTVYYSNVLKKYHRIFFRNKISFLYRCLNDCINLKTIQVVHATTLFSDGAIAFKLYKKFKIPYVVTIRSTDLEAFAKYRPDLLFLGLRILQNASNIVFITQALKTKFFKHYFFQFFRKELVLKSKVISNGADQYWIDNKTLKREVRPTKIIYVGTFLKRKNVLTLISAVLKLKSKISDLELTIVGNNGEEREQILKLAENNPETIIFIGNVNNKDDLQELYQSNHIFAMPSYAETFGLVYIEALTQGLPILYSKNDGIDGTFLVKVGEAVNPKSEEDITNGLEMIIKNYSTYTLEKLDFSEFSWVAIAKKYHQIYHQIVSAKSNN